MKINFHIDDEEECRIMGQILDRAFQIFGGDKIKRAMDLTACHCNGTRLDLHKLLNADDSNFIHDILGIQRHINRNTGKLERYFLPRCTLSKAIIDH